MPEYVPVGGEFLVNSATLNNQYEPTITGLAGGGFVIVWSDGSNAISGDPYNYDVKAQIFAPDGSSVGGEFLVNSITSSFQAGPAVTALAGGGFVVSWTDGSLANGYVNSTDIRAQIFAADGSLIGNEFLVNSTLYNWQEISSIAALSGGGFVIVWSDGSNGVPGNPSGTEVRAQMVASDGTPVGSEIQVNSTTYHFQEFPTIAGLAGGGFVIAWGDSSGMGADSSNTSIKAQLYASDGTPVGGEFLVNSVTENSQYYPTISALDGGGFVISWQCWNGTNTIDIKAQIFAPDGSPVGGEFLVNGTTLSNLTDPTITGLDGGGFVIAWVDSYGAGADSSDFGIHAQVFAPDGSPVGDEFLVNAATSSGQIQPTITRLDGGGFVVSWTDNGGDLSGYAVKAQIYAPAVEAVAHDDAFATTELGPVSGSLFADNGAGADEGSAPSVSEVNGSAANVGSQFTLPSGALLTVNADGTFVYDPNGAFEYTPSDTSRAANTPSTDSFTYALAGGDTATVTLTISGIDNDDTLVGTPGYDGMSGGAGDDRLSTGGGDWDSVNGGAGTDTLVLPGNRADYTFHQSSPSMWVTNTVDGIRTGFYGVERFEFDDQTVELSDLEPFVQTGTVNPDRMYGTYASDHLLGGPGDDEFQGYDGNDLLEGGSGNDVMVGQEGTDTLLGGSGNDYLSGENGSLDYGYLSFGSFYNDGSPDHIDGGAGIDTVQFDYRLTDTAVIADFSDPSVMQTFADGSTIVNVEGVQAWLGDGNDSIIFGDGDNEIVSEGGDDVLSGGAGNDRFYGGSGNDTLFGGAGNDGLYGHEGDDVMRGGDGDDQIQDTEGNNIIDGGDGVDNTYIDFSDSLSAVTFLLTGDQIIVTPGGTNTLISIEAASIVGSAFDDHLTGSSGNDWITGNAGNNSLYGVGGNDQLWGNNGDDLLDGGDGNDNLQASGGNDSLYGGAGDDWLDGGDGSDLLDGGDGVDRTTLNFYSAAAGVSFSLSANPTIISSLGTETLVSIEGADFYGSQFVDTVTGGSAVDYMRGWVGNDVLDGAGGNDRIYGDQGNDQISGGDGDDYLEGGAGTNTLDGGAGTDRTLVDFYSFSVGVNFALTSGVTVTDFFGTHTLINIEAATIYGTGYADTLTGGSGADSVNGKAGDDVLHGAGGNDSLSGGLGNDTLYGGDGDDSLDGYTGTDTFDGGAGMDRVSLQFWNASAGVNFSLADNPTLATSEGTKTLISIEGAYVAATGFDDSVTGGEAVDQFYGQGGNDQLYGLGGNDILNGGDGDDTLVGGDGNDELVAQQGNDSLTGGAGNDMLRGNAATTLAVYEGPQSRYLVAANPDGSVSVTDTTGVEGVDTLWDVTSLQFSDGTIAMADALEEGNEPPVAQDDAFTTDELTAIGGDLFADNGAGADSDPDGPPLSISEVNGSSANVGSQITLPSGALLTVNSDGSFEYDPNGAFQYTPTFGSGAFNTPSADSFSYTLAGGDTATVILTINGVNNDDTVIGSDDGNRLISGSGNDLVFGLDGNDYITGGNGDDYIDGGDGIDRAGWYHTNAALGGATVNLQISDAQNTGSQGWDTLVSIEYLSGTPFADTFTGDDYDNILWGSVATISPGNVSATNDDYLDGAGGNDLLAVGIGNHTLIGGNDNDTLWFTENGSPEPNISVALWENLAQNTGAGTWTLSGIENLFGGVGDDSLEGDDNDNVIGGSLGSDLLFGYGSNDTLYGDGRITSAGHVVTTFVDSGTEGGDDQLFGGGGDDTLYGGAGNDVLRGAAGNDVHYGGIGDDLIVGGFGDDLIDGGDGYDRAGNYHVNEALGGVTIDLNIVDPQDTGSQGWDTLASIEYVSGTPFADTLIGDGNDNVLWGSAAMIDPGSNWVSTSNNDTLDGGEGNDLLYVGIGNHSLTGGGGSDTVAFTENWGDDPAISISLALQGSAQDTGQGLWTLTGIENLSGGDDDDQLTGDDNVNILAGSFGSDTLRGGGDNDSLYGDGVIDTAAPSTGAPTLYPDVGANGNDTLEGGLGNDLIDGGGGSDTASYANAGGGVTVNLGSGISSGADGNDTLVNIENATGSQFSDNLTGSGGSNLIDGLGGNDTISGGAGDDTLYGGDGDDFVQGDFGENNITVTGNDVLYGGNGNDLLRGGLGNDSLYGGANNDNLRGNGGVDYFDGGADDGLGVNGIGDRVSFFEQRATQGVVADLRTGIISNDGFGNVETMVGIESLGGGTAFADTFYGNDGANFLAGDRGDSVYAFGGDDIFQLTSAPSVVDGGDGWDRINIFSNGNWLTPDTNGDGLAEFVGAATVGWTVNLAVGTIADGYGNSGSITGIEEINGSHLSDSITGDGNANILNSGDGNDTIDGSGGNDTLDGGNGIDTTSFASATGNVYAYLYDGGSGEAFGAAGYDTLANFENLTGSAFNDILYGNSQNNVVSGGDGHDEVRGRGGNDIVLGGDGDDFLNGGLGDDIIDGGAGVDRVSHYTDATAGVTVNLSITGPQDTGQGMDTFIGIENVSGTLFGDVLTGDDNDNVLWGSASTYSPGNIATTNNDTLSGGGGNDLLWLGIGNHVVDGGSGTDTFRFNENGAPETGITLSLLLQGQVQASGNGDWILTNIENLSGSTAGDNLTGDENANVLAGDLGDDTLVGGAGNDTLYGDGRVDWDDHDTGRSGPITTHVDAVASYGGVSGNDTLEGGLGDDQLYGGGGNDTASYANAGGSVTVGLYNGGFGEAFGADGYDQLHDIEDLIGSAFNDILFGNNQDNILSGGAGDDQLRGNAGNDTMLGGDGNDFLGNGAGDDLIDGGAGFDRVSHYTGATNGVTVDLRIQGIAQDTGQGMDTLIGIENVSGTQFADTLIGDDASNWLWGSPATLADGSIATTNNDTIFGGGGNDGIWVGIGNHVIDGGTGIDTLRFTENANNDPAVAISLALQGVAQVTGQGSWTISNIENLDGGTNHDFLTGDANANILAGRSGNDVLVGGSGNDSLYGDGATGIDANGDTYVVDIVTLGGISGNDTLEGGLGNDHIDGGGGTDTVTYANASGGVTVTLFNNLTGNGTATGADGNDTLVGIENVVGSAFNDSITGSAGSNLLSGGDGNDFLQARGGDDSLYGGNGNDYVGGGTGNDLLDGGAGYDRASFSNGSTGPVTVDLRIQGVAQNTGLGNDTLIGIENLTGTAFGDTLTGDDGDNWLWGATDSAGVGDTIDGQGGNDLIEVGVGDHVLIGGTGNDTFSFNPFTVPTNATISLALQGAAQNTGAGTMTLSGFENLSGSSYADTLIGDGLANILAGSEGGDALIGGAGNDALYGDGLVGTDTSPSGQITFYADVTTLGGIAGDDTLEGGLGNDLVDGGGGTDTASYANAAGAVTVTLTAGGGSSSGGDGTDTLVSIENVAGGAFNDILTGNSGDNALAGGDGHDTLSGGGGNDTLQAGNGNDSLTGGAGDDLIDGGAGFDRANYNVGATAGVTVDLSLTGAQNTGQGMDTLTGVEHVVGTTFNDVITGDAGDNWLWGGSLGTGVTGNDIISGGNGNDLIEVGTGNHTLNGGGGTGDTLSFWAGGTDVTSTGVALNLGTTSAQNTRQGTTTVTGFENLSGSRYGDVLTGDANNNILAGNTGNDTLTGGLGGDTLYGDGGFTTFTSGGLATGPIRLVSDMTTEFGGVAGADTLNGGDGDDFLYGGGGNDILKGDKDNDTLFGGTGNDTLVGGNGNDQYVIEANSGADTISGFAHLVDNIYFDASSGVSSFSQLTLTKVGGTSTLVTWGNGNSIMIQGLKPTDLSEGDFSFATAAAAAAASLNAPVPDYMMV